MSQDAPITTPAPVKMVPVRLLKNYRPRRDDGFEIVGYDAPAKIRKNAAGVKEVVEPARFVAGELPPPVKPGTGFASKLWAGAVIKLPVDEAKAAKAAGIAEYELDD